MITQIVMVKLQEWHALEFLNTLEAFRELTRYIHARIEIWPRDNVRDAITDVCVQFHCTELGR